MKENNLTDQTDEWRRRMMWPCEIEDEALLVMESMKTAGSESGNPFETDIYFVNNSGQTIDNVCYGMGGFITDEDDVVTMSTATERSYEDVKHGEAVRFDFATFFDQDFIISYAFEIKANHLDVTKIQTELAKGGPSSAVLLWADLPGPFKNPDAPTQSLDAIEAAQKFVSTTGKPLAKSIIINKGDLYYGAGDGRLVEQGIHLKRTPKRGGKVMVYEFSNENGDNIYYTVTLIDAKAFIDALKLI